MYPQQPYPPQFPVQPGYPAQQYPQQPAYPPPQQYAQPAYAPPAAPRPPAPVGTLDDFYDQPASGGGPSFKFIDANRQPQIGKSYAGIVARAITNADVQAQVDPTTGVPRTYKDGRPKFVLVVPMMVQPSQEFPDGVAGWWVKGQARDELARAMAEAGAPVGPPEAGAGIRVTLVSTRPVPNMNPAFVYRVEYMRPQGAMAAPAAQPEPLGHSEPIDLQSYAPAPVAQPYQQPAPAQYAQPQFVQPVMPQPAPQPAPVAAAPPAAPAGFSPDQAALFARLTGGQAPAA